MILQPLSGKAAQSIALATARINVWEGSVRSSKTIDSLLWWLRYVRRGPAGNLAMVGKTERTLKRNVVDPLIEMVGPGRCRYVGGAGEVFLLGRRVYLAGANDERAQEKIRGLTLAGAYVDEASIIPESFWSMLLTRLSIDGAQLGATTNPDNPNHWLLKDYLKRAATWLRGDGSVIILGDEPLTSGNAEAPQNTPHNIHGNILDLARFSFRLADNPTLSEAYKEALAAEFTGLWHRRFVLGEWVAAEGAIYDMFRVDGNDSHVVDALPTMTGWWMGVDYGTTNPFVALLIGEGVDGRLYVAREWRWDSRARRGQLTDAQYSQRLRTWWADGCDGLVDTDRDDPPAVERTFIDPSAASFITQVYSDDNWARAALADNTVLDGIRDVSTLLSSGRLRIHRSCAGLIDEMTGYVWDDKAQKQGEDKPVKVADHGPDALRYACRGLRFVWRPWIGATQQQEAA